MEIQNFDCCVDTCKGKLNPDVHLALRTGCRSHTQAIPCELCGRLHFIQNNVAIGVYTRSLEEVFLIEGELVLCPQEEASTES